jgi:hypothetical protein
VRHWIYAMLSGQFHCGLPQWLRQLRPPRLSTAKLIQLALQLHDCLRNRWCDIPVHYQTLLGA